MIVLAALWIGGAAIGFPMWMLADHFGYGSASVAYVCGVTGMYIGNITFGILVKDHDR